MPFQPSLQAPGDPGRQKMKVPFAMPPQALDCTVEVPMVAKLTMWNSAEKPSMSLSNSGLTASGVTSRIAKPVPPVVITTSISGSLIHFLTCLRISFSSSSTIAFAAS
jgi:hypothetical protein